MERAVCEQCGHWQPGDWAGGDLCVACGAAVRREVRCPWCTEWIPAGKFCRSCGCQVVSPEEYGPARMLKSAGIDRFTLVQRLREMDPEQAANLGRIYNAQLAVVVRRIDEVRLCESRLLQKGFSRRLEEALLPQLPMETEALAALAAGPSGPFTARPDLLPQIARESPVARTRTLACIALLRIGHFEGTFVTSCQALSSEDPELALEAALAFPHWRVRLLSDRLWRPLHPYSAADAAWGIDPRRLAEVAGAVPRGSPLRPWAAAAMTLAWCGEYGVAPEPGVTEASEWVREELHAGLTSRDPDLRFTCAMALGEDGIVARALHSDDEQQRVVARRCLARHKSPAVAALLKEGPEEILADILDKLSDPLPEALVGPVLEAVERASPASRADGVRLLRASLNEGMVERLVRLAQREHDPEVLKLLLGVERLPAARKVVRAALDPGWFEALSHALWDSPEHVDFSDEAVAQLAVRGDAVTVEKLVGIAEQQCDRLTPAEPAGVALFLVRLAFGSGPTEVRERAWRLLEHRDERQWNWLSPSGIRELFGDAAAFLTATVRVLGDAALESMPGDLLRKLLERWPTAGETLIGDREALIPFVRVLRQRAGGQIEAARLLAMVALSCPAAALPAVAALLKQDGADWRCRDIAGDLLAEYDSLAGRIGDDKPLAADLADALVTMLGQVSLEQRFIPALELLARLAQDHAGLREGLAARAAPMLGDRALGDRDLKPALDRLTQAVGFQDAAAPQVAEESPAPAFADAVLDGLVMLPACPLKTLAEYCAFMKAMGAAADPMAVMASFGLTLESMPECVERWGEVICGNDQIALRYARLMTPGGQE